MDAQRRQMLSQALMNAGDPASLPPRFGGAFWESDMPRPGPDVRSLVAALAPGFGDVQGPAQDLMMFAGDPASRTPLNYGLAAAGALPFVPSLGGMARAIHDIPSGSWYKSSSIGDGAKAMYQVHERPSEADIAKLIKKGSGTLRAVKDTRTGDFYVWDAEQGLHEEVIRHLGLGETAENVGQIGSVADFKRLQQK